MNPFFDPILRMTVLACLKIDALWAAAAVRITSVILRHGGSVASPILKPAV